MKGSRRWQLALAVIVLAGVLASVAARSAPAHARRVTAVTAPSSRPNILVLMSDDQAQSTFSRALMPTVFRDIVDQGVNFSRGYVETPLCCPSRAQTLTGLSASHTGVTDNYTVPLLRPTIVHALKDVGYRTLLAGKYLNTMSCDPQAQFDDWWCYSRTSTGYS